MVNAIISSRVLGFNGNLPFISLAFAIKGENEENNSNVATVATKPISLIGSNESLANSGAAYTIGLVLEVVGVNTWEDLLGKAVQIELDDKGNIIAVANILDAEKYVTLGVASEDADEVEEVAAEVVE